MISSVAHWLRPTVTLVVFVAALMLAAGAGCETTEDPEPNPSGNTANQGNEGSPPAPRKPGPEAIAKAYLAAFATGEPFPDDDMVAARQRVAVQYASSDHGQHLTSRFVDRLNHWEMLVVKTVSAETLESTDTTAQVKLTFDYSTWMGEERSAEEWTLALVKQDDEDWRVASGP